MRNFDEFIGALEYTEKSASEQLDELVKTAVFVSVDNKDGALTPEENQKYKDAIKTLSARKQKKHDRLGDHIMRSFDTLKNEPLSERKRTKVSRKLSKYGERLIALQNEGMNNLERTEKSASEQLDELVMREKLASEFEKEAAKHGGVMDVLLGRQVKRQGRRIENMDKRFADIADRKIGEMTKGLKRFNPKNAKGAYEYGVRQQQRYENHRARAQASYDKAVKSRDRARGVAIAIPTAALALGANAYKAYKNKKKRQAEAEAQARLIREMPPQEGKSESTSE